MEKKRDKPCLTIQRRKLFHLVGLFIHTGGTIYYYVHSNSFSFNSCFIFILGQKVYLLSESKSFIILQKLNFKTTASSSVQITFTSDLHPTTCSQAIANKNKNKNFLIITSAVSFKFAKIRSNNEQLSLLNLLKIKFN